MILFIILGFLPHIFQTSCIICCQYASVAIKYRYSIAGNGLNLGLNLLGCFVHDLRLQCLEFFGKFYKDGGIPFRPLNIQTRYFNIADYKEEL